MEINETHAPQYVIALVEVVRIERGVEITLLENFASGKSGAFVARVSASGSLGGTFVMKVSEVHQGWEAELQLHEKALNLGAFSGHLPKVEFSHHTDRHSLVLFSFAGESRIEARPLIAALGLFEATYRKFVEIAWTPKCFSDWNSVSAPALLRSTLDYRLDTSGGGRIRNNMVREFGSELMQSPSFLHEGELLPNPIAFVDMASVPARLNGVALLGPVHGDCHSENLFVRTAFGETVEDVFLIDLEMFREASLVFFDHAYLELSILLQQLDGIADHRWLQLACAVSSNSPVMQLNPTERGWCEAISSCRKTAFSLADGTFSNRHDDLRLQFLLAHAAAGLAFLNKVAKSTSGMEGLSTNQYQRAFIWSTVHLREYLKKLSLFAGAPWTQAGRLVPTVPADLSGTPPPRGGEEHFNRFDETSFNLLVLSPLATVTELREVFEADWKLVLDFAPVPPVSSFMDGLARPFRQAWPRSADLELRQLHRGGIWFFANGRSDISGVCPATSPANWRRVFRRDVEDLLRSIASELAPSKVNVVILADGLSDEYLKMLADALQDAFESQLGPLLISTTEGDRYLDHEVPSAGVATATLAAQLKSRCPARWSSIERVLVPARRGAAVVLEEFPNILLKRISRDITLLHRGLAKEFPADRVFGVDFHRGMEIEWGELDARVDVPRDLYSPVIASLIEELQASSTRTVNLIHEASAGGTTLARRLGWDLMDRFQY